MKRFYEASARLGCLLMTLFILFGLARGIVWAWEGIAGVFS